ncbi:MAG: hypothetical protein QM754_00740 [Tepidisphaeraceae bacterium]
MKVSFAGIVTEHYDLDGSAGAFLHEEVIGDFLNGDYYVPFARLPGGPCRWFLRIDNYGPAKFVNTDGAWCSRRLEIEIVQYPGNLFRMQASLGDPGFYTVAMVFAQIAAPAPAVDGVISFTSELSGHGEDETDHFPHFHGGTATVVCATEDSGFPGGTIDDECVSGDPDPATVFYAMNACSAGGLSNVFISKADRDAHTSKAVEPYDGKCYVVNESALIAEVDLPDPAILLDKLSFTGCAECECGPCGDAEIKVGATGDFSFGGQAAGVDPPPIWNDAWGVSFPPAGYPAGGVMKLVSREGDVFVFENTTTGVIAVRYDCIAGTASLSYSGPLVFFNDRTGGVGSGTLNMFVPDVLVSFDSSHLTMHVEKDDWPSTIDGQAVAVTFAFDFSLTSGAFCE